MENSTRKGRRIMFIASLVFWFTSAAAWAQSDRAQKAFENRSAVKLAPNSNLRLALVKSRTPLLTDRRYHTMKLPRGVYGATLVVRNSKQFESWLPAKHVIAKKECKVYVAIQTRRNREVRAPQDLVRIMKQAGWELEKNDFTTSSADKEIWLWAAFSRTIKPGAVNLKPPIKSRTAYVFMFK